MRGALAIANASLLWASVALLQVPLARAQTHALSRQIGGTGFDEVTAAARDVHQNLIVAGSYADQIDLGGGAFVATGSSDNYLAAFDPDGSHVWSRTLSVGPGADANDVAFDPSGNIVITGQALLFDSSVVELDSNGSIRWQNGNGSVGTGVAVDALGNV